MTHDVFSVTQREAAKDVMADGAPRHNAASFYRDHGVVMPRPALQLPHEQQETIEERKRTEDP
eukprot:4228388-Pyramimonas_sp.AAC.1